MLIAIALLNLLAVLYMGADHAWTFLGIDAGGWAVISLLFAACATIVIEAARGRM
jgi:hypothetical protein